MGSSHLSLRSSRRLAMAGLAALGLLAMGHGRAHADDTMPTLLFDPTVALSTDSATRSPALVLGLDALNLMLRERREQRHLLRMLPLMSTPVEQGRLWVGLTRDRSETAASKALRLELRWVIPLGQ